MTTDELIAITAGILDRLMLLRDITSRPDCNTCKQRLHEKCPKLGQSVVYGCPLYEKKDCLKNEGERMMECKCDCLLSIDGKCTRQSKENMTALEKWKNDFKGFISELSIPKDDYDGIMEYIDEVPIKEMRE